MISLSITNNIQYSKFAPTEEYPCKFFYRIQLLIPYTKMYYIRHINFYSIQLYNKTTKIISQAKKIPIILPLFFLDRFYKKSTIIFTQSKQNTKNCTTSFPPKKQYHLISQERKTAFRSFSQ